MRPKKRTPHRHSKHDIKPEDSIRETNSQIATTNMREEVRQRKVGES